MWTIEKPLTSALECFDICIDGIRDVTLRRKMQGIREKIKSSEKEFDQAARATNLHCVPATCSVGLASTEDMKNLYNRHMVRATSRGREIYDVLMLAAPSGQCPFCGHRDVSTLDHCMPKTSHPALAVTPINLVPCCKDCNHKKGNLSLSSKVDQLLNPYYDNISDDTWLYAEIIQGAPPGARFYVMSPSTWNSDVKERVKNHFVRLELAKLYASNASRELQNIRGALSPIFEADGPEAVAEDLRRRHKGFSDVSVNTWQGALYRAAMTDRWYCDGGFALTSP